MYLQLLLLKDKVKLGEEVDISIFSSDEIKNVLEYIKENPEKDRQDIFENTNKGLVEDLIFASSKIINSEEEVIEKDLKEIYMKILNSSSVKKKKQLSVKIAIAEEKGDLKESKRLLNEYQNLVKK